MEVIQILLIGGMLFVYSWSWQAVGFALFLFMAARPVSGLVGTGTPWNIRVMTGWFGVRGIGSPCYQMYAIQHGLPKELAMQLIHHDADGGHAVDPCPRLQRQTVDGTLLASTQQCQGPGMGIIISQTQTSRRYVCLAGMAMGAPICAITNRWAVVSMLRCVSSQSKEK